MVRGRQQPDLKAVFKEKSSNVDFDAVRNNLFGSNFSAKTINKNTVMEGVCRLRGLGELKSAQVSVAGFGAFWVRRRHINKSILSVNRG